MPTANSSDFMTGLYHITSFTVGKVVFSYHPPPKIPSEIPFVLPHSHTHRSPNAVSSHISQHFHNLWPARNAVNVTSFLPENSSESVSCSSVSDSLPPHGLFPTRLLCPWNSPGRNTGMGIHSFLQGIFLTQGSIPCSLHWQADSLLSEAPGNPSVSLSCYLFL